MWKITEVTLSGPQNQRTVQRGSLGGPVSVAPGSPFHRGRDVARDEAPCPRREDHDGRGAETAGREGLAPSGKAEMIDG